MQERSAPTFPLTLTPEDDSGNQLGIEQQKRCMVKMHGNDKDDQLASVKWNKIKKTDLLWIDEINQEVS